MSEDNTTKAAKTASKTPASKKVVATKKSASAKATKPATTKAETHKKPVTTKKSAAAKTTSTKPKPASKKVAASTAKSSAGRKTAAQPSKKTAPKPEKESVSAKSNEDMSADYSSNSASDSDTFVEDLKDKDWGASLKRGVFMLIFGFVGQFALSVSFFLAFLQFIVSLLVGPPNTAITSAIATASRYLGQILAYLSFKTDDLPFPFGKDFPTEDDD